MNGKNGMLTVILWSLMILGTAECLLSKAYDQSTVVDGQVYHFEAHTELGYVVSVAQDVNTLDALHETLEELSDKEISYIRRKRHARLSIVNRHKPHHDNRDDIDKLRKSRHVRYVAPLYTFQGDTIAITPEIILRMTDQATPEQFSDLCRRHQLTDQRQMEFTEKEFLLNTPAQDEHGVFECVERLSSDPYVAWAAPNVASKPGMRSSRIPNDLYYPNQWHLHNSGQSGGTENADIRAPEAWHISTGDSSITIAVLDHGIDLSHPDLQHNIVAGYDFHDDDSFPAADVNFPEEVHGTSVAGLAAAQGNNTIGVAGVAWNCNIMPIRILGPSFLTEADFATAIRWAAIHGADVVNNSWGVQMSTWAVRSAVSDVTREGGIGRNGKGCVVVWAAGNTGDRLPVTDPASYPEVIAVGASNHHDRRWPYSCYGPELDLVAPSGNMYMWRSGQDLWTTDITGYYGYSLENLDLAISVDYTDQMAGTSGACPIVAGVAALVLSVNPDLTEYEVRQILYRSAVDLGDPGFDEFCGHGRIDAWAALDLTLSKQLDLNSDGRVNFLDFSLITQNQTDESANDSLGTSIGDTLATFSEYWLMDL